MVTITHWVGKHITDDLKSVEEGFFSPDGRPWKDLVDEEKVLHYVKALQRKFDVMVCRPRKHPGMVAVYLDDLGRMFRTR
jgi:hypothetical protein